MMLLNLLHANVACNLLLTDAARYMVATDKTLKELFPNLNHVTCIAQLFHNCAEKVRAHFPSVALLNYLEEISSFTQLFAEEIPWILRGNA